MDHLGLSTFTTRYIYRSVLSTMTMARVFFPVTAVLALATLVSAQSSVSIFIVNADPQPLEGSLVGMTGVTTTYQVHCPSGTDSEECGVPNFTYIKDGTSSIQYSMDIEGVTGGVKCSVEGTTSAVCTASGEVPSESGASGAPAEAIDITTTLLRNEITYTQIPITGGNPAAAQSTGAPATTTSSISPSTRQTDKTTGSTSSMTGPSLGQASPTTGTTAGATSHNCASMMALVGAAALAAVLI
ncbi:MAG: hypothetical protein Q9186_002988 [Xanthomendoza sp. 1 TL-2023]